jgi:hypothetical protein
MPRRVREIIADRLEVILIEAMARGRRLARVSMQAEGDTDVESRGF